MNGKSVPLVTGGQLLPSLAGNGSSGQLQFQIVQDYGGRSFELIVRKGTYALEPSQTGGPVLGHLRQRPALAGAVQHLEASGLLQRHALADLLHRHIRRIGHRRGFSGS